MRIRERERENTHVEVVVRRPYVQQKGQRHSFSYLVRPNVIVPKRLFKSLDGFTDSDEKAPWGHGWVNTCF